ncbi:MAG: hypothetical protein OQK51_17705, partial [Kangiellaceae bacterium]|nr:hypothetical protein [Kangiellaceae bacterium]
DTLPDCYVIRESEVLNKLLVDKSITEEQRKQLFYVVVNSYSRYANYLGKGCVIKFTSHCSLHLDYILKQLPAVPWLYLFRNPVAIIDSLEKKPAGWLRAGFIKELTGWSNKDIPSSVYELAAKTLDWYFQNLLNDLNHLNRSVDDGLEVSQHHLVEYEQLFCDEMAAVNSICTMFGYAHPKSNRKMLACCDIDAKSGKRRKRMSEDEKPTIMNQGKLAIRKVCNQHCRENYEKLRKFNEYC